MADRIAEDIVGVGCLDPETIRLGRMAEGIVGKGPFPCSLQDIGRIIIGVTPAIWPTDVLPTSIPRMVRVLG